MAANNIISAVGRRKTSVARVTMKKGKGNIIVNNEDIKKYLSNDILLLKIQEPIILSDLKDKYDIFVNVRGGGKSSQADSIRQAIARGIVKVSKSEEIKKKFLSYDRSLLVTDTRFKEMKKPNNSHARAKRQKSYR